MGEQIADWLTDAALTLLARGIDQLPETWIALGTGLFIGYLWGRFKLFGLVLGGLVALFVQSEWRKRLVKGDRGAPQPVASPRDETRKKTLLDLFKRKG